ncbi:MAG: DNA polymerase III subunit chi [Methylotenera sp.]|uniref:DNA polymerase III subunit chi n=1 Tax=Methylotenera sp. TaxID=2051956 RepID=UPI0024876831|nr:DNA polymerase III subunit chi [Methylotenera sp.]MDI1309182.1 DNA polymerase III subunit chi [Methylotenera sp.]
MTRVEFYFNVSDKFAKTVELCEKALAKGRQLTIYTQNDAMSNDIQNLLWTQSPSSFLANSLINETQSRFSPIVIDAHGENLIQDDVLINFQTLQPLFFSRFRYLVELVGSDEADKAAARARFRFYKDRGYEIKSTDAAET